MEENLGGELHFVNKLLNHDYCDYHVDDCDGDDGKTSGASSIW